MATVSSHNKNNSAIKRIMQEARELANDPSTDYTAAPLEDDIFEWHCTLRGPSGTEFEGGLYHFRILLPAEYPFRPPSILMMTPNGRFELNTKICISFTNYHEELWQPAWGVRTAIVGLQGFFPLKGQAAVGVGAIEAPTSERKRLAKLSRDWVCPVCKSSNLDTLPDPPEHHEHKHEHDNTHTPSVPAGAVAAVALLATAPEPGPATDADSEQSTKAQALELETPPEPRTALGDTLTNVSDGTNASSSPPTPPITTNEVGPDRRGDIDNSAPTPAVPIIASASTTSTSATVGVGVGVNSSPRPPIVLDAAICVLLVLVAALLCKKLC